MFEFMITKSKKLFDTLCFTTTIWVIIYPITFQIIEKSVMGFRLFMIYSLDEICKFAK